MTLYVGDCRRCGAQRMSFEVYGVSIVSACEKQVDSFRRATSYWRTIELACRCLDCSKTTVFTLAHIADAESKLGPVAFGANQSPKHVGYLEMVAFPAKEPGPPPEHTPEPAASFYKQGATALAHGLNDAAGSMFRKCLEAATRSEQLVNLVPEGERQKYSQQWVKARLTRLKELHAIPPALADLADVIKDEGNTAVHENVLYDKASAEALQEFTETFLEQMFTIPARIKNVRDKRAP